MSCVPIWHCVCIQGMELRFRIRRGIVLAYGKKDFVAKRGGGCCIKREGLGLCIGKRTVVVKRERHLCLHTERRIGIVYRKMDCSCEKGKTFVFAYREIRECELSSPFLNVINVKV